MESKKSAPARSVKRKLTSRSTNTRYDFRKSARLFPNSYISRNFLFASSMDSQPKLVCLVDDLDRYNTAFETYESRAVSHGFKAWINEGLPDVASELKKTFPSDEVRLLSVGAGTGMYRL